MTLIIKELIIRGIVTTDSDKGKVGELINKEELLGYLEQIQESIKKDCIETVLSKLESKSRR
jgi:hypothetical protein